MDRAPERHWIDHNTGEVPGPAMRLVAVEPNPQSGASHLAYPRAPGGRPCKSEYTGGSPPIRRATGQATGAAGPRPPDLT